MTDAASGPGPGSSLADRLRSVLAGADLVAPIEHQRRIAGTVDGLIDEGRSPTLHTVGGPVPVLEVVRTETILYAARVALWRDLLRALPADVGDLGLPVTTELVAADRLVRADGMRREPVISPGRARRAALRSRAYRAREALRRVQAERAARSAPPEDGEGGGSAGVLLVPWRAGHVRRWRPVLDLLAEVDGWVPRVLASDPRTVRAAADAGLAAHRLAWGVGSPREDLGIHRALHRLAGTVDGPLAAALRAVPGPVLGPARAVADATAAFADTDAARVTVVPNPYVPEGRAAALVAQRAGLPVVSAQHGTIFPDDPRWQRCPVDRLCVWGTAGVDALAGSGLAPPQVVVTGLPEPTDPAPGPRAAAAAGSGAGPVLVATSGAGDRVSLAQHLVFLQWLGAAVAATPHRRWIVKLHPKDDPALYAAPALARVEVVPAAESTPPIDAFLDDAAVLVTVASATALDAARRQVPVVLVAVPGSDDHDRIAVLAGAADGVAHDGEELADLVERLTAHPPAPRPVGSLGAWAAPVEDPVGAVADVVRGVARR